MKATDRTMGFGIGLVSDASQKRRRTATLLRSLTTGDPSLEFPDTIGSWRSNTPCR